MNADFASAWQLLLGNEGGYVDNPADPGGATMYGVTERVARANGYLGAMQALPLQTAEGIAQSVYWLPYNLQAMPQPVAMAMLDWIYNGGPAPVTLQRLVGVAQDGAIGPETVAAVQAADPKTLAARLCAARLDYLASLENLWPTFGRGWARRVAHVLDVVMQA